MAVSPYSNVASITIKKKQTITFQPIDIKYLDSAPFQLMASSSSGLPVSFKIIEGLDKVELKGNEITILSLGVSKIGAYEVGNDVYHASDTIVQTLEVNLITGIEDNGNEILVYPNPVSDKLIIFGKTFEKNLIKIVDTRGQLVYSSTLIDGKEEIISFKEFATGLYILIIDNSRFKDYKTQLINKRL